MGNEARVHDPESMKTWKKPHAVAGMVLVVTLVATGALIAAANSSQGAAALTKRRSQLAVARAESSHPAGGGARPTFDGDRHQVDPTPSTTSTSTTSTTIDDRHAPECRNSTNPQCGPFRWDPQPLPNRPMRVDVQIAPSHPRPGDVVTFTVVASDPDAPGRAELRPAAKG